MSAAAIPVPRADRWLPLQFALRELRGGLSGFYVFIACIALGSMAISGVGSLAASLADGLAREGRVILGGDLSFTLIQREANSQEQAFLDGQGKVSSAATLRAMARTPGGKATLVELKAVDGAYPLFGEVRLDPLGPLAEALAQRDGVFGATADPTLLARLDIKQRRHRNPRGLNQRAGQACRRHWLWTAPAGERGSAARYRLDPARQSGSLELPATAAAKRRHRRCRQGGDGAGARAIARGWLGHSQP
jgi:hypothetical protein